MIFFSEGLGCSSKQIGSESRGCRNAGRDGGWPNIVSQSLGWLSNNWGEGKGATCGQPRPWNMWGNFPEVVFSAGILVADAVLIAHITFISGLRVAGFRYPSPEWLLRKLPKVYCNCHFLNYIWSTELWWLNLNLSVFSTENLNLTSAPQCHLYNFTICSYK